MLRKLSDPFKATEFLDLLITFVHPSIDCYDTLSPPAAPSPPLPPPFPPNPPGMPPAAPGCVRLYGVNIQEEIIQFDRDKYIRNLAGYLNVRRGATGQALYRPWAPPLDAPPSLPSQISSC